MTFARIWLAPILAIALAHPAEAGIIFNRKPKGNPSEQVPSLVLQLKTETDEAKRTTAAEELRQFDGKAFPEIATALTDALIKDASAAVRAEAASSLAKLRPVTQQAGYALEQAVANDSSMRVRLAARQALLQYHLVGYRSGKPSDVAGNQSGEPPLADAPKLPAAVPPPPATVQKPAPGKSTSLKPPEKQRKLTPKDAKSTTDGPQLEPPA